MDKSSTSRSPSRSGAAYRRCRWGTPAGRAGACTVRGDDRRTVPCPRGELQHGHLAHHAHLVRGGDGNGSAISVPPRRRTAASQRGAWREAPAPQEGVPRGCRVSIPPEDHRDHVGHQHRKLDAPFAQSVRYSIPGGSASRVLRQHPSRRPPGSRRTSSPLGRSSTWAGAACDGQKLDAPFIHPVGQVQHTRRECVAGAASASLHKATGIA